MPPSEVAGGQLKNVGRSAGLPAPGPVVAAVEAWMLLYKLTGLRPDELGRLDQINPSGDGEDPPIHRLRK